MTDTTVTKRHWLDVAKQRTADPVAHYAALGLAHMNAFHAAVDTYGDVCWGDSEPTEADKERFRAAVRAHLHEYAAAFTVCALLKGWTIEAINQELEDGQVAAECLWSWVGEGVDPESIAAAEGPTEAEKRGAVKALRRKAGDYALGDSPVAGPGVARDLDLYADAIERGEVTPL